MSACEVHTYPNGIRVVHQFVRDSAIVHCGFMIDIGSRDETPATQGITHFWEHMAFKGTHKRTAHRIANYLESLGGDLNAFTDKEKIFFHASVRTEHVEKAIELLADITFHAVFPTSQIERERSVVLEEMSMCVDDPDDFLQDQFDAAVFSNHSLGMNILGIQETVCSFEQQDIRAFINAQLDTRRIVFSCVGNVGQDNVFRLVEKHIGTIPYRTSLRKRKKFTTYHPEEIVIKKNIHQTRCALGGLAYSRHHADKIPFSMLVNMLGGPASNSRLNWTLREKKGYVYAVGSYYFPFIDTGLFMISFGTEPDRTKKILHLIKGELHRLRDVPLGVRQLTAARQQVLGQLALSEENKSYGMVMRARDLLDTGKIASSDQIHDEIDAVDAKKLMELANDVFDEERFCCVRIEPN